MTDPNLAEQAEREIREKLGFRVDAKTNVIPLTISGNGGFRPTTHCELDLWQALVRDRCSLLKLRKAAAIVCQASIEDPAIVALRSALEGD